ncbi:LuxR C-terminal-related transcriptional regulator [Intrasporangium mesophilum]
MKLLICDDHELIVDALGTALADLGYEVTKVHQPEDAIEAVRVVRPEACLLDANYPEGSGLDAIPRIREASAGTKVVIFSADYSNDLVRRAIALGASGYVRKDRGLAQLIEAIDLAVSGHLAIEPSALQSALRSSDPSENPTWMLSFLTDREWQVLKCVSDGLSTEEIAIELKVRRSTARTHVQNVLTKLGVHSRLQAAALISAHSSQVNWPRHVRPGASSV